MFKVTSNFCYVVQLVLMFVGRLVDISAQTYLAAHFLTMRSRMTLTDTVTSMEKVPCVARNQETAIGKKMSGRVITMI